MLSLKSAFAEAGASLPPDRQGCTVYRIVENGITKYLHIDSEGAAELRLGGDARVMAVSECPIHNTN